MEQNKYLGIYVASDKTTAVLISKASGKIEIVDSFSVRPEAQEQSGASQTPPQPSPQQQPQAQVPKFSFSQMAAKIAAVCTEKQFVFSDVAVAIDCRLYRQQKLHSEFQDYKQIAQTIKFDAEEALAVDAAQSAIAFEIVGKQTSGSDVAAFAAGADVITEIIKSLQSNKLDPVTVEPDSICLRRVIDDMAKDSIIAVVSQTRCFMVCPAASDGKAIVRSFLTSPLQNKTTLFAGQIIRTMSATNAGGKTVAIKVYDTTNTLDINTIKEQTEMTTEQLDIAQKISLPAAGNLRQDCEFLEIIIAAGAAGVLTGKTDKVDFRADFMPYQGRKIVIEKTAKIAGISLLVLFLVLGVILQMRYHSISRDISKLNAKFKSEYTIAMPGSKFPKTQEAVRKLTSEINRIKDVKSGMLSVSGADSIEAKLTYLFEALNSVPKNIDINVDKITVTTKAMTITGSTNLGGHLQLFGAFDKHTKLQRGASNYEPKDGRDNFRLTIELRQGAK